MKAKITVVAGILAMSVVSASSGAAAQSGSVTLGNEARLKALYSYPNNCDPSVCLIPQTLEQTVTLYLNQSLKRDGYAGSTVRVTRKGPTYTATFTGPAATVYPAALDRFLAAGDLALTDARKLNDQKKWQYNWRFFLPVGLAMVNHPTVELLHFPPDYSLEKEQDYLNSKTTDRWGQLLVVNGVPEAQKDAYQAVVDINPIAAPANAGNSLAEVEGVFSDYIMALLRQWTGNAVTPGRGKPMVAFGTPVRTWVGQRIGRELNVDEVATLTIPSGNPVPVIGANHPSLIFYAAWNGSGADRTPNVEEGARVMTQDLIAACWQAKMGQAPASDPQQVATACTQRWQSDVQGVCSLLKTTIYDGLPPEKQPACPAQPIAGRLEFGTQAVAMAD